MNKKDKIFIAGHNGLVGSAIVRNLTMKGFDNLVLVNHETLDLANQREVEYFFEEEKPDYVFMAAAKVGGISVNQKQPADFFYQNIMISTNVIHAAYKNNTKKLINLGSSCIYPRNSKQPIKEESLLSDYLEETNEAYAIAKISAIKMCKYYNYQYDTNFINVMPTNLYGPGDNYNLNTSHVLPALIRKFHDGKMDKKVVLWGDGTPRREFLYSDDLAEAVVFLMENFDCQDIGEIINIGTGKDISIKELAFIIAEIVNYSGEIIWDESKPNGTPQKLLDISKIKSLGWNYKISLLDGIELVYKDYLKALNKQ